MLIIYQLIKKITLEKDNYKYNTPSHYSINSCDFKPPNINLKKIETVHCKKLSSEVEIMENYICKTEYDTISNYSKTDTKTKSGSIIKYFKTGNNEIFLRKIGEEIKIKKKTSLQI